MPLGATGRLMAPLKGKPFSWAVCPPPTAALELLRDLGHVPLLWASVSSTHRGRGESLHPRLSKRFPQPSPLSLS